MTLMKLDGKGWFDKYLKIRKDIISKQAQEQLQNFEGEDKRGEEILYKILQPTGLMYGHPIKTPFILSEENFDALGENEKIKLIFTESLINCGLLFSASSESEGNHIDKITSYLHDFFTRFYPEPKEGFFGSIFSKEKTKTQEIESFIDQQVEIKNKWDNFWTSFLQNSFLFLNVMLFAHWLNYLDDDFIRKEKDYIILLILKIIAAASQTDGEVDKGEKKLFNYFLQSASISSEKKKEAENYIDEKINLEDIDFSRVESWIAKKYVLELAIITLWADKDLSEIEKKFATELNAHLGFDNEELERSLIAIEAFVLDNQDSVSYLQTKGNYKIVSERFINRFKTILNKNSKKIGKEISESKELVALLSKSSKEELTKEEKEKVRTQLLDILKTIPMLVIVVLPGSFLTLPLLMKILPKNALFPTSFHED